MIWRVQVDYNDGDDWTAPCWSTVEVEADTAIGARLLAQQMISTPMPGKPDHIQITGTRAVCVG